MTCPACPSPAPGPPGPAWAGLLTLLLLPACQDSGGWNPLEIHARLREERRHIQQAEEELQRLPEPRTVAQSHQRIGYHGRPGSPAWIQLDLGRNLLPDEVILLPARVSDPAAADPPGGFPPEVSLSLSETGAEGSFVPLAEWREESDGAGRDLMLLRLRNEPRISGHHLRIEVTGSRTGSRRPFFTLGEIVVLEGGANRALGSRVTTGPSIENAPRWSAANLTDGYLWCGSLAGVEKSTQNGFHSAIENTPQAVPKWVEVDLGRSLPLDEIRLVPARPPDYADISGFGFPPSFEVLLLNADGTVAAKLFEGALVNPGDATVCLPAQGITARRVRVTATSLWQRSQDYIFALAELQAFSGGENVALGKAVQASDEVTSAIWSKPALVDGFSSQRSLLDWPAWLEAVERRSHLEGNLPSLKRQAARSEEEFQTSLLRSSAAFTTAAFLSGLAAFLGLRWQQSRERSRLRQRIAQDLHDEMGSQLSHLALLADVAGREARQEGGSSASFDSIAHEARDLQHTMRDLVWLLEPQSGAAGDFTARLRSTCQRLLAPAIADIQIQVEGRPPSAVLPLEWTRDLLLFIKEALNNCARHSQARTASIQMIWTDGHFEWRLTDDGTGFDEHAPGFEAGAGLRNLRLRAVSLQADLTLASTPEVGTQIRLVVPLPKPRPFPLFHRR